jgi:phosphatidylinositol glycan class O
MPDSNTSVKASVPKAAPGDYNSIAARYARAKAAKEAEDKVKAGGKQGGASKTVLQKINDRKSTKFRVEWYWVLGFFVWLL